jgi:hypothetical protein
VAATHVVVGESPARAAGVAGGLQQTAMNVGPVLGVASATVLMDVGGARSPLVVLAVAAATAIPLCGALPGRTRAVPGGVPAGRTRTDPGGVPTGRAEAPSAGGSDAEHIRHGAERSPFPPSLRDDEV